LESDFFSAVLLPVSLGMLMLGMGLSLTIEDFRQVVVHPRSLITGLISQMILMPLVAFAITRIAILPQEIKVGFIIIAICPGGATSNLISYILRGNVALAISMTTVNSLLTIFTIPLILYFALHYYLDVTKLIPLPLGPTIIKIFYITLLPTSIGVLIRYFRREFALKLEDHLRYILPILYGIIFVIAILGTKKVHPTELPGIYYHVAPWGLLLNLVGMSLGLIMARIYRLKIPDQISLTVEIGVHNSALAITIAGSALFLNNYVMAIPAIVYGLFSFLTTLFFGYAVKRLSH
jgi:BASS family bile acid:Na+ symporter